MYNICSVTDIVECDADNGGCDQTCTNTIGSFFCTCLIGYTTPDDGFTCNGELYASIAPIYKPNLSC